MHLLQSKQMLWNHSSIYEKSGQLLWGSLYTAETSGTGKQGTMSLVKWPIIWMIKFLYALLKMSYASLSVLDM